MCKGHLYNTNYNTVREREREDMTSPNNTIQKDIELDFVIKKCKWCLLIQKLVTWS